MKKLFVILLALSMVLSLCACGAAKEAAPETDLQLGYAKAVITPDAPIPLCGYGDSADRISTEVLDDLYVICIALSDGTNTALLYSQDLNFSTSNLTPGLRTAIAAETRVPMDSILFAATGTYSAPDMKSTHENMTPFMEKYNAAMIQTAKDAMADLAPTVLYTTTTEAPGMAFVHNYTVAGGTVEDAYYGFFDSQITGHASQADETVYLVKADRPEGKADVLMVNFQARATLTGGFDKTVVSADFPGYLRDKIEADTGMKAVYFSGACGDQSPTSLIESEDHGLDAKAYGEKLAQIATEALPAMTILEGSGAGSFATNYNCPVHHAEEDKADQAAQVVAEREKNGDEAANRLARELGLRSVYNAAHITTRQARAEKKAVELSVIRLGGLGIATSPCNLYSATGEAIRTKAPTGFTLVLTEANAAWPCIPSEAAFDYGCHEGDVSYFAKGSAERVADLLCELLVMTTG